ncbi:hypothetical protein PLEOSDRAFT_155121 [Pleurotus ostreatus PC15]|uniref:Uncharacterized protein n=2 Tax=Pleurotus TaxID=5320 RepID=A0A067P206_PLEO1|nr:hypothetical protein CCMSSC00406_0000173 [Pleurotus cornucopiae]KDQ30442.1 hypothetical protein PLEOSDRAFT_155121 [Pleurotus ostreatus PC15]
MDELVRHCIREISFDGDLGSEPSRLDVFIKDFYEKHPGYTQNIDHNFNAFVWSLVVQQPTIRVGIVPNGLTTEVFVAPQPSAIKKAKAQGKAKNEVTEEDRPRLEVIADAATRSFDDLKAEFGQALRIAVDPEEIFAAITGSHVKPQKMTPMVYTALQFITRGRETGITVVELGRNTKYDQKSCFYLVKQLIELNLIVKVRRGGVGTHLCLHKHFYDTSPRWREVREEESKAQQLFHGAPEPDDAGDMAEEAAPQTLSNLGFTPIDARHLSSLPLIQARVMKLLKASHNHIHAANNMLLKIGFAHPTKTDRRFFNTRIRELIQLGLIEVILVPSLRKGSEGKMIKCFRLVTPGSAPTPSGAVAASIDDEEEDESGRVYRLRTNTTLHKQVVDLIEEAGTSGITMNELSERLGHFDKRTIDLLLTRAERQTPPTHLADLGVAIIMENYGRERRNRYFTVASYRQLLENENLDPANAGYGDLDLSNTGDFTPVTSDQFYQDEKQLTQYHDAFLETHTDEKVEDKRKKKKKSKKAATADVDGEGSTPPKPKKVVKPRKEKPVAVGDADGTENSGPPKRGRKRQQDNEGDDSRPKKKSKSSAALQESIQDQPQSITEPDAVAAVAMDVDAVDPLPTSVPTSSQPRKRGRPRKSQANTQEPSDAPAITDLSQGKDEKTVSLRKRRRGEDSIAAGGGDATSPDARPKRQRTRTAKALASQENATSISTNQSSRAAPTVDTTVDVASMKSTHRPNDSETVPVSVATTPFGGPLSPITPDVAQPEKEPLVDTPHVPIEDTPSPRAGGSGKAFHNIPIDPLLLDSQSPVVVVSEPALKTAASRVPKANVSHMRRENEFYQVLVSCGGILNINSKEFTDAHSALVDVLSQSGEPTSAPPGTRVDKRTVLATLDSMESKGRIKMIKTQIMTRTGVPRPTTVARLSDVDPAKAIEYLSNLSDVAPIVPAAHIKRIEEPIEYGAIERHERRGVLPLQLLREREPGDAQERWSKNEHRADQLWQYDDATIHEVLLTERTTVGQFYGFVVGKVARLRKMHLATLSALESPESGPNVVSRHDRIVHLAFYNHDLPLGLYLSLCAVLSYNEDLTKFYRSEGGAETAVKDLPPPLHSILQIGRSRARSRFLDLMGLLMSLRLVIPLQVTDSPSPQIQCAANGEHPTAFDAAPLEGWTPNTPSLAPSYWQFTDTAPVFAWSRSDPSPIFLKTVSVSSSNGAVEYWSQLREACLQKGKMVEDDVFRPTLSHPLNDTLTKSLRRPSSWADEYFLTWHQRQYLSRALQGGTSIEEVGDTPLDVDEEKLAWIVSAPANVVKNFLFDTRSQYAKIIAKARLKRERLEAEKEASEADKVLLADMAAEARAQRESEWADMVARVYPEPLKGSAEIRLRPVRKKFLQAVSVKDMGSWEAEIQKTLREAALAASKILSKHAKRLTQTLPSVPATSSGPSKGTSFLSPPVVHNLIEKSVAELIAQQGPAIPESKRTRQRKKPKKEKADGEDDEPPGTKYRRHRFQWDNDYEELARDASVIIKVRCRDLPRLELTALDQVFPSVPRNTVRQRLVHIRDTPGNEAYLKRLEEKWSDLWSRYRGTDILPDDDPQSASNFDLPKHIEFLRSHIDKNALRVGFTNTTNSIIIPQSVDELLDGWDVVGPPVTSTTYDFMWKGDAEEGREKALYQQGFCKGSILPSTPEERSEATFVAEAALKMVFGTPNERYKPDMAANLLRDIGQDAVSSATKRLLERGILSKHIRDPKREKPGRRLKISDANQNALGGPIPFDTFQDAVALDEDVYLQQESFWRTWPLLGTDGDLMSLLQQVSDNKVDFRIDSSAARTARAEVEWNSKKADDDDIETAIEVRFLGMDVETNASPSPSAPMLDVNNETDRASHHGISYDGSIASCGRVNPGLTDCQSCLAEATDIFSSTLSEADASVVHQLLTALQEAGERGLARPGQLDDSYSSEYILELVGRMTDALVPLAFWAGYVKPVLVSPRHLKAWSVLVSENPVKRVLPRRWRDMSGHKVTDGWDAALRAVISAIHFRPGLSVAELKWRLRPVYDGQEINDIFRALQTDGFVNVLGVDHPMSSICSLDDTEAASTYCFINSSKHWYMV